MSTLLIIETTSPIVNKYTSKRQNRFLGTKLYCIDFLLICKYFATEHVPVVIVHLCKTVDLNIQNNNLFELTNKSDILYYLVFIRNFKKFCILMLPLSFLTWMCSFTHAHTIAHITSECCVLVCLQYSALNSQYERT